MEIWEQDDTFLARWMNNELKEDERKLFENSRDYQVFKKILEETDNLSVPSFNTVTALNKIKNKKYSSQTMLLQPILRWALAASILLLLSLGIWKYFDSSIPGEIKIETVAGEKENVTLPDGSKIVINSKSNIYYQNKNWQNNRQVELNGEAFFDVKKGSRFSVVTSIGTIEVLGTRFNVKSRKSKLEVICYTGKVKVISQGSEKILAPGMGLRLQEGQNPLNIHTNHEQVNPSWYKGITKLNDVTLKEALDELSFQYGLNIHVLHLNDSIRFTGDFPHNDVETAVKMVLNPFNLPYELDSINKKLIIQNE